MQLAPQLWMTAGALRVLDAIAAAGGEARYVGGCVRDALLKRTGSDVDMACTLPPEATIQALEAAGIKALPTGLAHGTVTAICDSVQYELTTLRRDVACDGRHAEVAFTDDWREDAARRDFTMNALYADRDCNIYDYFGGFEDAQAGKLRFIGDASQRIAEDGLRILRYFRFFAHYGTWPMDGAALAACEKQAAMLEALSGERIQSEMFKLLKSSRAADVLEAMHDSGILQRIGLDRPNLMVLRSLDAEEVLLRLAALLRGSEYEPLLQRWKLSNDDKARLRALLSADLQQMATWDEWEQKKQLRRMGKARFADHARLAMAEHPSRCMQLRALLHLVETWEIPQFPVNGQDLLARGLAQGKTLGELLQRLESEWEAAHYAPDKASLLAKI